MSWFWVFWAAKKFYLIAFDDFDTNVLTRIENFSWFEHGSRYSFNSKAIFEDSSFWFNFKGRGLSVIGTMNSFQSFLNFDFFSRKNHVIPVISSYLTEIVIFKKHICWMLIKSIRIQNHKNSATRLNYINEILELKLCNRIDFRFSFSI